MTGIRTIDIAHDDADDDIKLSMPLHVLWAKRGVIETCFNALSLWRTRADVVSGRALDTTHYMAEEKPSEIAGEMHQFFSSAHDLQNGAMRDDTN